MKKNCLLAKFLVVMYIFTNVLIGNISIGGFTAGTSNEAYAATAFVPYECYPKLNFEGIAPDSSAWGTTPAVLEFVKSDPLRPANGGVGAMYVDSTGGGQFSVWGGQSGSGFSPEVGDTISGYFYFKKLKHPPGDWKYPRIRLYSEEEGNNEASYFCITKNLSSASVWEAPLGQWIKVELESTGKVVEAKHLGRIGFNITCDAGGNEFMLDDIVFGTYRDVPDPTVPPVIQDNAAVIPLINEYAGSTVNGDFEVGNDSVGNQYWGTSPADMMRLITPTNVGGTAPGSVKSGNNMIEITKGGTAWNLFNFSSTSDDSLPRINDIVGGSYWLYVPANADLSKGVPYVYNMYQNSSGVDTKISTAENYPTANLVKGAWNQIPITPMADGYVKEVNPTKYFGTMISAPAPDAGALYYIDQIKVGTIKKGLFLSSSTLCDDDGISISAPSDLDTEINANIVIQNSIDSEPKNAMLILTCYEGEELIAVDKNKVTIDGTGSTGISVTTSEFRGLSIEGYDKSKLSVKLYVWDSTDTVSPLTASHKLYYQTKTIAPNDSSIKYIGRWAGDESSYKSSWIRPYLKTRFTGSSIKINLTEATSLVVTIDGDTTTYNTVNGLVSLAEGLSPGVHDIRIATLHYTESIKYSGLVVDADSVLSEPVLKPTHIEFIGDSITAWDDGYSWQVGEKIGNVEHSRIAWPGIALQDDFGYTGFIPLHGISSAYFKLALPGAPGVGATSPDWDFEASQYKPDILVINIGTNDCETIWAVPSFLTGFTNTYSAFIDNLRVKFPDADIFVMRAVSMPRANVNDAITDMLTPKLSADSKLHYIDTTSWDVSILSDNVHPDTAGHTTITNKLIEILTPYLR